MWTLETALPLVRMLQPQARRLGYHICLGGGVLNNGSSRKDLDLFFLPLNGTKEAKANPEGTLNWLVSLWGPSTDLFQSFHAEVGPKYAASGKFDYSGLRIDVFILT